MKLSTTHWKTVIRMTLRLYFYGSSTSLSLFLFMEVIKKKVRTASLIMLFSKYHFLYSNVCFFPFVFICFSLFVFSVLIMVELVHLIDMFLSALYFVIYITGSNTFMRGLLLFVVTPCKQPVRDSLRQTVKQMDLVSKNFFLFFCFLRDFRSHQKQYGDRLSRGGFIGWRLDSMDLFIVWVSSLSVGGERGTGLQPSCITSCQFRTFLLISQVVM